MKTVQVFVDYTNEVNSLNKDWINQDDRNCSICVESDDHKLTKYSGRLTSQQIEHIVILIQDNSSQEEIISLIEHYQNTNADFLRELVFGDDILEE